MVHCDSQSTIYLIKIQIFYAKTNHINVKLHFIRDMAPQDP